MHLKETLSKSSGVVSLTLALGSVPGTHWISDIQPSTQGFWYCSSPGGSVVLKASGHPGLPPSRERFWGKNEKSIFDDDFDFWGTIFGITFVDNP